MNKYMKSYSQKELLDYMRILFAHLVDLNLEEDWPVTEFAFNALNNNDVVLIEQSVGHTLGDSVLQELRNWKQMSFPHYRREILRFGCGLQPDMLYKKTKMTPANPPANIHSMIRQEIFSGDLYSGDMFVSALARAQQSIIEGGHYLDFGCSSGSLVRNVWARFPDAHWYGCDPVSSSIEWAAKQFPLIHFCVSNQAPPLPFQDNFLDGVYAISIWSHFSEQASLDWFSEMGRLLKSGGFLVFTTHGIRSLYYYLENNLKTVDTTASLLVDILLSQYCFEPVWSNGSEEGGLEKSDWGNSYLTIEWIARNLYRDWRVLDYRPGLNQFNQDVYVLQRL